MASIEERVRLLEGQVKTLLDLVSFITEQGSQAQRRRLAMSHFLALDAAEGYPLGVPGHGLGSKESL